MEDKQTKQTFYNGEFSHYADQKVSIDGNPRTPKEYPKEKLGDITDPEKRKEWNAKKAAWEDMKDWERKIQRHINREIAEGRLREIEENQQCNLFVTFRINEKRPKGCPDIDNLLKVLFDSLKRKEGEKSKSKRLIPDDVSFRGVRAEREMVKTDNDEGVDIEYVITKTFDIKTVEVVSKANVKKLFRRYWDYPMRRITACDMEGKECKFIDNEPGHLFLAKPGDIDAKFIPPGYNWGDKMGKRVDGCMVFKKEILETQRHLGGNQDLLHWLTKW